MPCCAQCAVSSKDCHSILKRLNVSGCTGIANATTAGWGNLGGGVTQLLMPLIFLGIKQHTEPFIAWRWAMFVPAFMHIISGIMILFFAQDLPDGNYAVLKSSGGMQKDNPMRVFITGIMNYRCAPCCTSAHFSCLVSNAYGESCSQS